jgi:hypothetical protein
LSAMLRRWCCLELSKDQYCCWGQKGRNRRMVFQMECNRTLGVENWKTEVNDGSRGRQTQCGVWRDQKGSNAEGLLSGGRSINYVLKTLAKGRQLQIKAREALPVKGFLWWSWARESRTQPSTVGLRKGRIPNKEGVVNHRS